MGALLGGGSSTAQKPTKYIGIVVQTSIKGNSVPRGWGTFKGGCNLLDYLDFTSKAVKSSAGGKGLGGQSQTTYNYSATVLLGLVRGPIAGIRKVYKDQATYVNGGTTALAQAGLSLATGAIGQAVWGYLTTSHPTHALGYSHLAYCYAQGYALNTSATLQNHTFEIQSTIRQVVGATTLDDANGKDILTDLFSDLPRWPTGALGSLTDYGNYCLAAGLLISPYSDSTRQLSDLLKEILLATNSDCIWSDGQLKVIPYGDTAITGNGVTWTPNLTPVYDLTWDNFLAADGEDPIQWDFVRPSEAYNYVQLEYLDRTNNYVTDVQPAVDQANIDQFGLRKQDPTSVHSVCDPGVAATLAQLMVQRTCNVRRTGTFELPETFGLLNPQEDLLTVPLRNGGRRLVRIVDYQEKPDSASIEFTVEEMLVGVGHAALYSRQSAAATTTNFSVSPGNAAAPTMFDVPVQLVQVLGMETWIATESATANPNWGGCEVWVSTDDVTFGKVNTISGASRMGTTTATFASGSDPDTTSTLSVDLTNSFGVLESGTHADADNGTTICYVDGEYIAYSTATLTSAFNYNLTSYLRRGLWGSQRTSHAAGSLFVRLDDSTCKIPYNATDVGRTLHVKLLSFNIYGQALQQLSDVTSYPHTIGGPPTFYGPNTLVALSSVKGIQLNWNNSPNVGQAAVEVWRSPTSSFGGATQLDDAAAYTTSYIDQTTSSNTQYWYWIRARDIAGNVSAFTPTTSGAGATATSGQASTLDVAVNALSQEFEQSETIVGPTVGPASGEVFLFDTSSSTGQVYMDCGAPVANTKYRLDLNGYSTRLSGRDPVITLCIYSAIVPPTGAGVNDTPGNSTLIATSKFGGGSDNTNMYLICSGTDNAPDRYYYCTIATAGSSPPSLASYTVVFRSLVLKQIA